MLQTSVPLKANSVEKTSDPLRITSAKKRFGAVQALADVSLALKRGELVGLLGPNGAGKTTLIKAIAGRLKLDAGTISVFGRELALRDKRPEIGVVPQELAVYNLLTARENLEVFGALYGVPKPAIRQRVAWALEWADLKDRADEPVKTFSGGMKRRLNMACSLLHEPTIVLLDEPTVGVDPQSRERIYEMLSQLQRSGVSIVLTTHHLEEAERRCERIVIIDRGRIVASGTLAELMTSTLGASRTLTLTTDGPLPSAMPDGAVVDAERNAVRLQVRNLGAEIVGAVTAIQAAGGHVTDLHIAGASLQDVFIALTGRELRE